MSMLTPFTLAGLGGSAYERTQVQPFTYRSAITSVELQERLKHYVLGLADQVNNGFIDIETIVNTYFQEFKDSQSAALSPLLAPIVDVVVAAALGGQIAPPPSGDVTGATDQAALQAILDSGANMYLRAGHYYVNGLTTPNTTIQPRVIGAGKKATILEGVKTTSGRAVLRFACTSGGICGGCFESMTITGNNDVGVKIVGACGIKWKQILFDGSFLDAIQLFNDAGGYTEFCAGEAEFSTNCTGVALHYSRSATGDKSFHGSGLTEGSIINQSYNATAPCIVLDDSCHPYNSPLDVAVFTRRVDQPVIRNKNVSAGDHPNFYGNLTIEQFVDGTTIVDPAYSNVYSTGTISIYGKSTVTIGPLSFYDTIWNPGPNTDVHGVKKRWAKQKPLAAGTFNLITLDQRCTYLVSVRIQDGTAYYYDQLLYVVLRADVGDGSGWVNVINTARTIDTNAKGAPVWGISNNLLTLTNANYSSTTVATYSIQPMQPYQPLF